MTVIEYAKEICFDKNRNEPFIPADYRGVEIETVRPIFLEGIKEMVIFNEKIVYNITDNVVTVIEKPGR